MDTDGDWMWDDWEIENGFNPNSAADEQVGTDPNEEDTDGDGATDTQHHPETEWTPLGVSNEWFDDCGLINVEPPSSWGYGTFDYAIQVRWRVTGVENGQGEFLVNRTQLMTMHDSSGKSSVQKMNWTATRTP